MSSAAIAGPNPLFDLIPGKPGSRVAHQVGLTPRQLFLLPVVDGNRGWTGRQVVPEILYQLKFLRGTQVEDGR